MAKIERVGASTYYLKESEAVVSFSSSLLYDGIEVGKVEKVQVPGNDPVEIMKWGTKNDLPQVMEQLVTANNIVPALLGTKRNILTGNGLMAYKIRYETGQDGKLKKIQEEVEIPAEVQAWLDGEDWETGSNFYEYLEAAAGEFVKHSLIIPEFIRYKRDGQKIKSIEVKECKWMRAARKMDGRVKKWYWSGHWTQEDRKADGYPHEAKVVALDVYTGEQKKQGQFIMPVGDYLFNDGYYPIPTWRGSKDWIEMANFIAPFHKANLQNSYNIRWHCQIPHDYFLDYEKYNVATDAEQAELLTTAAEKEQAFMDDVNEFLAGIANAGRTVWTKYEYDRALGREYPGIKITPLEYDMKDESLLKLFERSNTANISSQGIHPTLANIETAGKLSSGTEIRNAFLMWLIINTSTPRKMMLKPLELVKKVNGWPADIHYAIRDYELTALSSNDAGMQERKEPTAAE